MLSTQKLVDCYNNNWDYICSNCENEIPSYLLGRYVYKNGEVGERVGGNVIGNYGLFAKPRNYFGVGENNPYPCFCSQACFDEFLQSRNNKAASAAQAQAAAAAARAAEEQKTAQQQKDWQQKVKDFNAEVERKLKEKREELVKESIEIDGAYYSPDKTALVACSPAIRRLVIPEGVMEIGENACMNCESLKSVTIPNTVEEIGGGAFRNCKSLESITIPASVKKWGSYEEETKSYYDNDKSYGYRTITTIYGVFAKSGLVEAVLLDGLKEIGKSAFQNCKNLKSITIPDSVETIGEYAFLWDDVLESVKLPKIVNDIGKYTFEGCKKLSSVEIPEDWTVIGENMFCDCTSLKSITIPKTIKEIRDDAFRGCTSLESVVIPSNVETIGERAFQDCKALKSVVLEKGIKTIKGEAFTGSGITSVTIPEGVDLETVRVEINGGEEDHGVFYKCKSLKSATFAEGKKFGSFGLFWYCTALTSVSLPSTFKKIAGSMFRECASLQTINIPTGVTEIGNNAFSSCKVLSSIILPENVAKLGKAAFFNCWELASISIPASIVEIGSSCFGNDNSLIIKVRNGSLSPEVLKMLGIYAGRVRSSDGATATNQKPEESTNASKSTAPVSPASILDSFKASPEFQKGIDDTKKAFQEVGKNLKNAFGSLFKRK